jgi:hypothetical protein
MNSNSGFMEALFGTISDSWNECAPQRTDFHGELVDSAPLCRNR